MNNSYISYRFQGKQIKSKINNNNTRTKHEFKVKYEGY
jgi:hypothetical protein